MLYHRYELDDDGEDRSARRSFPPPRRTSSRSRRTCSASCRQSSTSATRSCACAASRRSATTTPASPARRISCASMSTADDERGRDRRRQLAGRGDDAAGVLVARGVRELAGRRSVEVVEHEGEPTRVCSSLGTERGAGDRRGRVSSGGAAGDVRASTSTDAPLPPRRRRPPRPTRSALARGDRAGAGLGRLPGAAHRLRDRGPRFEAGAGAPSAAVHAAVDEVAEAIVACSRAAPELRSSPPTRSVERTRHGSDAQSAAGRAGRCERTTRPRLCGTPSMTRRADDPVEAGPDAYASTTRDDSMRPTRSTRCCDRGLARSPIGYRRPLSTSASAGVPSRLGATLVLSPVASGGRSMSRSRSEACSPARRQTAAPSASHPTRPARLAAPAAREPRLARAMFQVRIHGRGGQGVVTAAELLSIAAFAEGRHAQAFPSFGSERTGAPVVAFCRIDDRRSARASRSPSRTR